MTVVNSEDVLGCRADRPGGCDAATPWGAAWIVSRRRRRVRIDPRRRLAAALPEVPVLVNGGVCSVDDAKELVARTGAAASMVGSALLCDPRLGAGGDAARPADLADEYLDMCERHSVPSPLFMRRHLRWIFRAELEPDGPADLAARDSWRARLWTFLVRPYLETLWQFREVVRLFRHLEAGGAATDGAPSFTSVRSGEAVDDDDARGNGSDRERGQVGLGGEEAEEGRRAPRVRRRLEAERRRAAGAVADERADDEERRLV